MLAERLGCTVEELLERISARELAEWHAFERWKHEQQEQARREAKQ